MSDSWTQSAPKIIVAKDLRIFSRILVVLAFIWLAFGVYSLFSGNLIGIVVILMAIVQIVVCMIGLVTSESSGYIYTSLRNGAIGSGLIAAYNIASVIAFIVSLSDIYANYRRDTLLITLVWIVLIDRIIELGAYAVLSGLFVYHALRAKKQLSQAPEFDPLTEQNSHATFEKV